MDEQPLIADELYGGKEIVKPDHQTMYLEFWHVKTYPKTSKWEVVSKTGYNLGYVKWFARWRQYCFFPYVGTVFNRQCMKDISEFIDMEMKARRKNGGKKENSNK